MAWCGRASGLQCCCSLVQILGRLLNAVAPCCLPLLLLLQLRLQLLRLGLFYAKLSAPQGVIDPESLLQLLVAGCSLCSAAAAVDVDCTASHCQHSAQQPCYSVTKGCTHWVANHYGRMVLLSQQLAP
jgi:hypothetical protein